MNSNHTFKQCISLSKALFGLLLLISFSCANAALPGIAAVAPFQKAQTYRIQNGDTLWSIASKLRPASTFSVEQVMLALLKENPKAFTKGNIHGIKLGYVLRMPGINSIKRVDKQLAKAEVKKHAILWRKYQSTTSQSGLSSSIGSKKLLGFGGGLSSGQLSNEGSGGDRVALPKQAKSPEVTKLLGQLSSTHKSIETEKHEKKVLQARITHVEKVVDKVVAAEPPEKILFKNGKVASEQSAAKEQVSKTRAEEVMQAKEEPVIESEESLQIKSASAGPASDDEQPMADESDVNKFDEYSVVLKADKKIIMPGLPGTLTVWIGDEDFKPSLSDDKVHDEAIIAAVGDWAVIEPFSTAFVFKPVKSECIKIHTTGSEEQFQLTPKDKGVFEVGVKVNLYDSEDCSSSPVPKSSSILEVTVEVDNKEIVFEKLTELWDIFWEKLLEFWGAFLVVTFGLLMFLYKNKLKKLFKFDSDDT